MNLEKFTQRAQAAISNSQDIAIKKGHHNRWRASALCTSIPGRWTYTKAYKLYGAGY